MSLPIPAPTASERFTTRPLEDDAPVLWHHVYATRDFPAKADTFAEGWGDTRFAPIHQSDGTPVHTYYAASSIEAAFMESILHDVPLHPPGMIALDSLEHFRLASIELTSPIVYASFHTHDLPRLQNLTRTQLIDTPASVYPQTRAWAQAAYDQCADAQAIGYGSRKNDAGRCLMLFRQRLPTPPFAVKDDGPLALEPLRSRFVDFALSLDLRLI